MDKESGGSSRRSPDAALLRSFRRLSLESALAEVTLHLARYDVRPLLLKGPAFARWLYEDHRERTYGDLDLLVSPEDFDVAMRAMAELGFTTRWARDNEGASYHVRLVRPGVFPVIVELHRTLPLLVATPSVVWQRLSEGADSIVVAGTSVDVPSRSASAMIVGLHAAQHNVVADDHWVPPLGDLHRALDRVDPQTWREAAVLASDLGAGAAFVAGLRLDPGGCVVADGLELGEPPEPAVRRLAGTAGAVLGLERFASASGTRAHLSLILAKLVPSPDLMREKFALARRGRFGLVRAYLRQPFHVARRLPRGLQARHRARVSSSDT